ncbi:MAG: glycerate kinase [Muribaculaceae bacterium]|nr:glycerate kinase [Muribaculaceae bacterium]
MRKIVAAVDSFKGSASSKDICHAVALGCHDIQPHCEVIEIPIADGGEGTLDSLAGAIGAVTTVSLNATDAIGRPLPVHYLVDANGTAYIELATAAGLPHLKDEERNPLYTTTFGVGTMITDALQRGCSHIVLGIGGSATNDAGIGILVALGYRFRDGNGNELPPCGASLTKIATITAPVPRPTIRLTVLADVENPFCGPQGAAYIYALQKGATPEMCQSLDLGMQHFANIAEGFTGVKLNQIIGGGAAGGVGAAMVAFLGAEIKSGIDFMLDRAGFDTAIEYADMVITGEGRLDSQSGQGKAVSGIIRSCAAKGIPVVAIAGAIEEGVQIEGLHAAYCINPAGLPLSEAMKTEVTLRNIRNTLHQILR